ncbi:MAG: hypothetical protein ACE5D7_06550 [Fidelibacterota bacterium]
MNIDNILNQIRESFQNDISHTSISDSDIMKFIDGNLEHSKTGLMNTWLSNHPATARELYILRQMVLSKPEMQPPKKLHDQVLKSIETRSFGLMNIVIKKMDGLFEIIQGKDWIFSPDAKFAVRGNNDELVFKTEKSSYFIFCHIEQKESPPSLYFSLRSTDSSKVKNGRFRVKTEDRDIFEIVTDKMGITAPQSVDDGNYEIDVEVNREKLGTINLSIR